MPEARRPWRERAPAERQGKAGVSQSDQVPALQWGMGGQGEGSHWLF